MAESDDRIAPSTDSDDSQDGLFRSSDYFIAVMGVTGVGKSTFINHLSNKNVEVGHTLKARTQKVKFFPVQYTKESTIWLLDTPGFDDTDRNDTEVLKEIAAYLVMPALYENRESKLDGIIYLHRINDVRMGGSAQTNLFMFQKLCGKDALARVILATTMWEKVTEDEGSHREAELKDTDNFWGGMISCGSTVHRHVNTRKSAMDIVEHFVSAGQRRQGGMVLDLQKEMVDDKLDLNETGAGKEVDNGLAKARDGFQRDIDQLQENLIEAKEQHNEEMIAAVQKKQIEMEGKIERAERERDRLKISLEELYKEKLDSMQQIIDDLRNNPLVRSHPLPDGVDRWTASMSLFGDKYWFDGQHSGLLCKKPPPGIPTKCLPYPPNQNNNRCIAFGERNSWYIHYRDHDEHGKLIERSSFSINFATVYPGAYRFLHEDHQDEPPTCISLSTSGHYFVRTAAGCHFHLPQSVEVAIGNPSSKESVWLGAYDTWIAQSESVGEDGEQKNYTCEADLKHYYTGMQDAMNGESGQKIRAAALNPTDSEQWTILWYDGTTRYGLGNTRSFEFFAYQEWCTVNFGSQWNSVEPQVGRAAKRPDVFVFMFDRFRSKWKPWKTQVRTRIMTYKPRGWTRRNSTTKSNT